jgi:DNA-binding MarR family transcriptional regulator
MAATAENETVTHQSLALINHLARVSRRGSEQALAPSGLRSLHLVALTLLRDHGSTSQQGLVEALRIDASNLVGLLNDLEREGLLVRERDPADRRRHIVALSAAGAQALERAEQTLAAVQEEVLGALDGQERATLHALLLRAAGGQLPNAACSDAAVEEC